MNEIQKTDISLSVFSNPPRSVRTSASGKKARAMRWLIIFSMLALSVWLTFASIQSDMQLEHGARATGTVIDKYCYNDRDYGDVHGSMMYRLQIRFPTEKRVSTEAIYVDRGEYERYKVGEQALVSYAPQDPSNCRIGIVTPEVIAREMPFYMGLILPWFAILAAYELLFQREKKLLRYGCAVVGTVERTQPERHETISVFYRFEAEGAVWNGKTYYTERNAQLLWKWRPITVLYLPGNPKVNKAASGIKTAELGSGSF